jgi:hypothetical protein
MGLDALVPSKEKEKDDLAGRLKEQLLSLKGTPLVSVKGSDFLIVNHSFYSRELRNNFSIRARLGQDYFFYVHPENQDWFAISKGYSFKLPLWAEVDFLEEFGNELNGLVKKQNELVKQYSSDIHSFIEYPSIKSLSKIDSQFLDLYVKSVDGCQCAAYRSLLENFKAGSKLSPEQLRLVDKLINAFNERLVIYL